MRIPSSEITGLWIIKAVPGLRRKGAHSYRGFIS